MIINELSFENLNEVIIGKNDKLARNTIRVSLCEETTLDELKIFIEELKNILETIK